MVFHAFNCFFFIVQVNGLLDADDDSDCTEQSISHV